jgi:hypothetical protein
MGEINLHLTGLDLVFWAGGFTAHAALLVVLWIRQRAQSFPIFTGLIGLNIVRTIALLCIQIYGSNKIYFYAYWSLAILDVGLQLGVVYEMASHIFRPLDKWASDITREFWACVAVSLSVAAFLTSIPKHQTQLWIQSIIIRGSFFSAVLMSELFVGMIALSVTAGLSWKTHVARISQGLGFYSLLTIAIECGDIYFGLKSGTHAYEVLNRIRMSTYIACVIFWIVMLWRPTAPGRIMNDRMRRSFYAVQTAAMRNVEILRSRRNL